MWNLWPHGPPRGASGKNLPANAGDMSCRFDPWVRKILWSQKWQPTLVFLPGESPWTEEPSGLQSIGLQRVRHDWAHIHILHLYLVQNIGYILSVQYVFAAYFIHNSLYFLIPYPNIEPPLSPLPAGNYCLFSISVSLFLVCFIF